MRKSYLLFLCLLFAFILTGCAGVKTYTYETDRVDQDLSRGNRGVIMGDVSMDKPERKSTRTMVGVDVILPPSKEYTKRKGVLEEGLTEERPVAREMEEVAEEPIITLTVPPMPPGAPAEEPVEEIEEVYAPQAKSYTVQKGDTLQKISDKFYGTTRRWTEIYEANKDALKHPSRIYPGQVITIPALVAEVEEDIK